jgi:hypothetical protein
MSDMRETIGGRKHVGPEDEAREDQMNDDGLAPAEEDEDQSSTLKDIAQLVQSDEAGILRGNLG